MTARRRALLRTFQRLLDDSPRGARSRARPDDRRRPQFGGQIMTALGGDAPNLVALV